MGKEGKRMVNKNKKWSEPVDTSGLNPFSTDIDKVLPKWGEIPDTFKDQWMSNGLASEWFYKGLNDFIFYPREGVDLDKAISQLHLCLSSWEPKHERKIAGVEFLLSQFFEKVMANGKVWEYK